MGKSGTKKEGIVSADQWPEGETMPVACPNCARSVDVQIAMVRDEFRLPWRPADCDTCLAEFDLSADGSTTLTLAPPKESTAAGRELLKKLNGQPIFFDPSA